MWTLKVSRLCTLYVDKFLWKKVSIVRKLCANELCFCEQMSLKKVNVRKWVVTSANHDKKK